MKCKYIPLLCVALVSLTSCGEESKDPNKKVYYLVDTITHVETSQPGGVKVYSYTYNILVFDITSKDTVKTNYNYNANITRYALFFVDGSASLYEYARYNTGWEMPKYEYQPKITATCDYSIVDDKLVGRNFSTDYSILEYNTFYFESGRVVAKRSDGTIGYEFVTENYAKKHDIQIIKPGEKYQL